MISIACGRGDDVVGVAVAELGGEQGEHRPHPLAAGLEQVAGGDVRDGVGEDQLGVETALDLLEAVVDGGEQLPGFRRGEDAVGLAQVAGQAGGTPRGTRIHVL